MRCFIHLLLVCMCCLACTCYGQEAFFDPTFGVGGKTIVPISSTSEGSFSSIALQPDGRIIAAGIIMGKATIARFKENGTPDTSFATNGFYTGPNYSRIYDLALQPDGKIVAAGNVMTSFGNDDFLAIRLTSSGSPDLTFGSTGIVNIEVSGYNDRCHSVALQGDGKIVMAGEGGSFKVGVSRLQATGIVDSSFGVNGVVVDIGAAILGDGLAIAPDGKIVVGGHGLATQDYALMVIRYSTDGTRDTSFDHTGLVYTIAGEPESNFGASLSVQPDGKILMAGTGSFTPNGANFVVVRYNSDGSLDPTFGSSGIAHVDVPGGNDALGRMYLKPDGKMLLVGSSESTSGKKDIAIACMKDNGIKDDLFGSAGAIVTAIRDISDYGADIVLQTDNKVVIAGTSFENIGSTWYGEPAIARYMTIVSGIDVIVETENSRIVLYPNPASTETNVISPRSEKIVSICAFDSQGRKIELKIQVQGTINIDQLPSGHYTFKIVFVDGSVSVEPVVIKK